MEKYSNINGNSGVIAYDLGHDFIRVKFINNSIYLYTVESAGRENINQMKSLAKKGLGLSTFISQFINCHYAKREQ